MKQYFLQFDFWNEDINEYFYGCITVDLTKTGLKEVCRQIISKEFNGIYEDVEIKVNALNNISL